MNPQFTSKPNVDAHSSTLSSSSSSASDRRLNALVRHLAAEESSSPMDSISASPTAARADSVFAHVVQGPEDPILGVTTLLSLSRFEISVNLVVSVVI